MGVKAMAKKKTKGKKSAAPELPENALPQNILAVGEHVEENKNIYISQPVYKEIHKFTKNKTTNESGGMLLGTVIEEFGKTNIVINGFVEAKHCEATPTTLKFTHETWEHVHKEIDEKHKGKKIVGWIHTHPDFGIFLSEYDKFIHQNFFSEDYQVAYVVDPIQHIEGFYFWINGSIEKCRGFYIYDKTGVEITAGPEKEVEETKSDSKLFSFKNILIAVLSIAVVLLVFANISANSRINSLEDKQTTLINSVNQGFMSMQQTIFAQENEIQELRNVLKEAGLITEPAEQETQDNGSGQQAGDTGANETDGNAEASGTEEGAAE